MPATAPFRTVAVIVAAGRGHRVGGDIPKQYLDLVGAPILARSVAAFLTHPDVNAVLCVIHPDDHALYEAAIGDLPVLAPVHGGATRQDSVRHGLQAVPEGTDRVLIHDAARPFIDHATIGRVLDALDHDAGAIPAVSVADTLKTRAANDKIGGTVDRSMLVRAQTPQGFRLSDILAAHQAAMGQELTDDAAVLEAHGLPVALVVGHEDNFKITTEQDLMRASHLLSPAPSSSQAFEYRTGCGFDVHRLVDGDGVIVCGITIPHDKKLAGHSDADVGLHTLTDAILGAIGAGDIGTHFPPTDPQWKGAPSDVFLAHAVTLVKQMGGAVTHVDLTVICEAPKVGPHRPAMRTRVAEILQISEGRVSIKATTTEKLGFTGRGEGIAAQATATVRLPFSDD